MQFVSEESIKIVESSLSIEDALKENSQVSLKIDAAHAGVMNGNFLFYLPKALREGSNSLNAFYKPLQKKHYSKTLGYIYKSEYVETNTSSVYYNKIINAESPKQLVSEVKDYLKSRDYRNNSKGFGVLVAKAKLYDKKKIQDLKYDDVGTVSVAGDAGAAYCSICEGQVAECGHKLGTRYKNELCFGIVSDDFDVDHISFETIPANWETKSLIIADSQLMGNIELIKEGHLMKLSLSELKEKVVDIESVLKELNLESYIEQYKTEASSASKSQFLLSAEQLLPINTPLTIYVTEKLLEKLELDEDKQVLLELFGASYSDIFADKTKEEVDAILTKQVEEPVAVVIEPIAEPVPVIAPVEEPVALAITDADKIVLAIADQLTATMDNAFSNMFAQFKDLFSKENTAKANKILEDKIEAYKEDLASAGLFKNQITDELKESLLNQIVMLKGITTDSEYFLKLKERTVQELKMTLEDHIELSKKDTPATPTLAVQDNNQQVLQVDPLVAKQSMDDPEAVLVIEDSDKLVEALVAGIEDTKLSRQKYTTMYKSVVLEHGSLVAKKLHNALKAQNKI